MSSGLSLAALDNPPAAPLDPTVWSVNLAALDSVDSDAAGQLRAAAPAPEQFRPVYALDGTTTFLERLGPEWRWWGATSAPASRAAGLFPARPEQQAAVLLCDLGTATDLAAVLQSYAPAVRVFVSARRWIDLAAALSLRDFSADLSRRRCWLLPPGGEPARLTALPRDISPPLTLLRVPYGDDLKFDQLQTACAEAWRLRQ